MLTISTNSGDAGVFDAGMVPNINDILLMWLIVLLKLSLKFVMFPDVLSDEFNSTSIVLCGGSGVGSG